MKPFNCIFVIIYYVVGLVASILHPTTVEGMEKLPPSGVLLCPNHASNWDPILIALRLPINYRLHIMAKAELFRNPLLGLLAGAILTAVIQSSSASVGIRRKRTDFGTSIPSRLTSVWARCLSMPRTELFMPQPTTGMPASSQSP